MTISIAVEDGIIQAQDYSLGTNSVCDIDSSLGLWAKPSSEPLKKV